MTAQTATGGTSWLQVFTPQEQSYITAIGDRAGDPAWEASEGNVGTTWSGAADWSGPIDDRELVATASPEVAQRIADDHNAIPLLLALLERQSRQVSRVRDVHRPVSARPGLRGDVCAHCHRLYPCPTILTLDAQEPTT